MGIAAQWRKTMRNRHVGELVLSEAQIQAGTKKVAELINQSEIVYHQNIEIEGKDVIVIDDAIESGGTMKRLVEYLSANYQPKSLSIATLFVKPGRVDIPFPQLYAYEMENDDLLVGYGLPWNDKLRNIPYVSKLVK
jgi:hypoxanthine phosphoribosyltransferase